MTPKTSTLEIKQLVNAILANPSDYAEVEKNINQIHVIFQNASAITGYETKVEYLAAVPTAKGKALGLNHAAQCLLDYKRTVKFLQAMVTSIQEKQKMNPGKRINIFYAGCGPYAPFVSLIAPLFSPEEIGFSLLEINKISLESAKRLLHNLELNDFVQEFHLADAVTFEVPNPENFDILFSETLDALLYRECYVPILFNLLPQFSDEISLIPENVCLRLKYLGYPEKNADGELLSQEYEAGKILDAREAVAAHVDGTKMPVQLPDQKIDFEAMERYKSVVIDTEVQVYKDIRLLRGESSLTLPLTMDLEKPFNYSAIIFTYHMEPNIELKYRLQEMEN